jgi:hypothetical protein
VGFGDDNIELSVNKWPCYVDAGITGSVLSYRGRTDRIPLSLVRQRARLFGVMAVMGLVLAIILPFLGAGMI